MCGEKTEKTKKMCGFKFKVIEIQFSSKISSKLVVKFKGKNFGAKKGLEEKTTNNSEPPLFIFYSQNFL